jgi:hypothetical protein
MEHGMRKKLSTVKSKSNSTRRTSTVAAQSNYLSLFSLWYSQLSPFESGLFWGILIALTATVSATIGASLTLINPVSKAIATLVDEADAKETEIFADSQLNLKKSENWSAVNQSQALSGKDLAVLQSTLIALENTTNRSELAVDLLFYLNERNLNNVYLNNSLSLELEETEIIFSSENFQAAKNLQKMLGIGQLKPSTAEDLTSSIIIRLGKDAQLILQEDSFIRE